MNAVYLTTNTPYGTPLRSDTLWGLLIAATGQVHGEKELLRQIEAAESGNPTFRVSSAMPFEKKPDESRVHYFPRPLRAPYAPNVPDKKLMERLKLFKKVSWLPQPLFESVINGQIDEKRLFEQYAAESNINNNKVRTSGPSIQRMYSEHVSIDRLKGSTLEIDERGQLFTRVNYVAPLDGGLFFLLEGNLEVIEGALRFLEHFGFGGDNSVGKGHFKVEVTPFTLQQPSMPTHFVTLSLYAPTSSELNAFRSHKNACWYELEIRRGRVGSHFVHARDVRKRPVPMFREGSSFPAGKGRPTGRLAVVKEIGDIHVRHSGLAFPVAARME